MFAKNGKLLKRLPLKAKAVSYRKLIKTTVSSVPGFGELRLRQASYRGSREAAVAPDQRLHDPADLVPSSRNETEQRPGTLQAVPRVLTGTLIAAQLSRQSP